MLSILSRLSVVALVCATFAVSFTSELRAGSIIVANDSGGVILDFAIKLARYRQQGNQVEFSGRCDSSCTLLLTLPRAQTCISPGAYFRFHAPSGGSPEASLAAKRFLLGKYPAWVRGWISARGGLTSTLLRMDYDYARKYMRDCRQEVALR